jgi:hypothetical protein
MNPEDKKMTVDTGGASSEGAVYQLEVKTGHTQNGVTPTMPVRLLIQWEDVQNTPVVMCIDGGNASGSNWGTTS